LLIDVVAILYESAIIATMKGADLFVRCLEAAGVETMFGVPGEENLAFLESIRTSKIRFITTHDEQSAVFMAAASGRLSGKIGVALSTLGPGATNLVTGVAYAHLGGMPVLVITGQKPVRTSKQGRFQIVDVVRMMEPITKYAASIPSADRIPSMVHEAIKLAEAERPGAVHLELPEDIAEEQSNVKPIASEKIRRPIAGDKAIGLALEAIEKAKSPLVIIGSGANRKLVRKQFRNFLEKTHIPFVSTQMGKGVEDESLAEYVGTTALSSGDYVHEAIKASDCIVMVGHDVIEKPPAFAQSHQTVIHINFYPASVDAVYAPQLEVVGDISHTLWVMTEKVRVNKKWDFKKAKTYKKIMFESTQEKISSSGFPLKPQRIVADLRKAVPRDGILSLDNGMYKLWIARNYPAYEQNSVLLDNALATMGAGLPVGMSAKLLFPKKPVVVVAGDGGFMMNVAELETAVRLQLDLVVVVLNDSGYGMIKWKQEDSGFKNFGLDFANPDFVLLAQSFGAHGRRIERADEFEPAIAEAIKRGGVHVIDVPIDYSENKRIGVNKK
jgi:acetolactate synthase-1/2/3 large subunit